MSALHAFMRHIVFLLLAATALLVARERSNSTLTIVVEGVRNSRGVVGVLIFSSPRGWPEDFASAFRAESVPAHPGTVMLVFDGLPPGAYAAVVLHDENANRKLDRSLFGVPREGWGMSNNPKAYLAAPSFESARFVLQERTELRIHLNY